MGPDTATEAIRKALSMGADKAVHVLDDGDPRLVRGADLGGARRGAGPAGVRPGPLRRGGHRRPDEVMPALLAERLGIAAAVRCPQAHRRGRHGDDRAADRRTATGPSRRRCRRSCRVWDTINEPRYPSFKGIMAAKKKPVETLSLADLGRRRRRGGPGRRDQRGASTSPGRPPQGEGVKVTDEGDGAREARRVPRRPEVRLTRPGRRGETAMAEVLVLVEPTPAARSSKPPWRR